MRHSTQLEVVEAVNSASHVWDLARTKSARGDLHVVVDAGDLTTETEWQFVPRESEREEYEAWLGEVGVEVGIDLPVPTVANHPYETVAYVRFAQGTSSSRAEYSLGEIARKTASEVFALSMGDGDLHGELQCVDPERLTADRPFILASARATEIEPGSWAFGSGIAFDHGTMRRGSETARALQIRSGAALEAKQASRYESLQSGDFITAVWHSDGSIEFHTDYAGTSAWYEYKSERVRIVASSFLLAAWLAKECGERLSLDLKVIDADFTSLTQPFQQPLLDDLELAGFSCLRADQVLVLSDTGGELRELSQFGRDIVRPDSFTISRYNELVDAAVKELVDNCGAIASDPSISHVRCDISGGLDSRLVLAGFLAGPSASVAKLSLYTETAGHSPSPKDQEVAMLVSDATGIPFDDQPEVSIGPCTVRHIAYSQIVANFGTYWHRTHGHAREWDPTTVYAGGAGLDNIARDYTTSSWQLVAPKVANPQELSLDLAHQMFKWRGRASLKAAPRAGLVAIAELWGQIPGDQLDKGSHLFNFYRARFHGGGANPAMLGVGRVGPGPTRSLHLLRLMSGRVFSVPRVQLEILHRLNPSLAAVPYGDDKYNKAYSAVFGLLRSDLAPDSTKLSGARDRRSAAHRWAACPDCEEPREMSNEKVSLIALAEQALRELGNDPVLNELMLPAFRFARDHLGSTYAMDHSYAKTFVNKVLQLHAMWRLTLNEDVGESIASPMR